MLELSLNNQLAGRQLGVAGESDRMTVSRDSFRYTESRKRRHFGTLCVNVKRKCILNFAIIQVKGGLFILLGERWDWSFLTNCVIHD